jgi:hypothetical protein
VSRGRFLIGLDAERWSFTGKRILVEFVKEGQTHRAARSDGGHRRALEG